MKRLFIDLEKCDNCPECVVKCSYLYHPQNNGVTSIRELATFALICHRCEEAPCVNSCYHKALKKDDSGILKRAKMLCTSCKTCSIACPFGVIFPDFLQYLDSRCDYCIGRQTPACIPTCPHQAIEIKEIEKEDISQGIYYVSDSLAVKHSKKWFLDDKVLYLKKK
ncbi:MAG: 4Fe-4S binding protein [Candidatus Omnitrophica bacterium]|nr:4Fe-4S binding protein [Candidatus Omnitrophota bacterium]